MLNNPSYVFHRWHGTLIMWAVMTVSFAANVYAIRILPLIQLFGGIMHIAFFVALIVPLVLLAPRSTPDFVFTQLLNEGGWASNGVSWCLGMLTVTYCFIGEFPLKSLHAGASQPQDLLYILMLARYLQASTEQST